MNEREIIMSKEEIFNIVKENILIILEDIDSDLVTIDKRLKDLGANSIDRVEIVTMSAEVLKVKVPAVKLASVKNIEDLVDVLYNQVNL